jgi:hypothetical protein
MKHNLHKKWQIEEGGEFVTATARHPWYGRAVWHKGLRVAALQRNPICQICNRRAATRVDHIKSFISPEGVVSWALFSDAANHRASCEECHNRKTATVDGGFGNPRKNAEVVIIQPTGDSGRQYASSSVSVQKLNAALAFDVDDLLKDIPA